MEEVVNGINELWKIGAVLTSIIGSYFFVRYQIKKVDDVSCINRTKIDHVEKELDEVKKEAAEIRKDYVAQIHKLEIDIMDRIGIIREDLHKAHKEQLILIGQLIKPDANNT